MTLPIVHGDNAIAVIEPATGEAVSLPQASDHALAHAAEKIAEADRELYAMKRALAHELRERHGVGTAHAGGYRFQVSESVSWPQRATEDALKQLVAEGRISEADAGRCMPARPKPDARQLKALAGRLAVSDPEAARVLSEAATVSPPSVRDVAREAVDGEAA